MPRAGSWGSRSPSRSLPPVLETQPQDGPPNGHKQGAGFRYQGGQVRSLLSLLSYLGSGEYRERYLGVKIPPTNLQEHHLEEARKFAAGLANRLTGSASVKHDIA